MRRSKTDVGGWLSVATLRRAAMLILALVALPIPCATAWAGAPRRVALVIANSAYEHAGTLPNAPRDAQLIVRALANAGFEEIDAPADLNLKAFNDALRRFKNAAHGADIALIYYAGHGVESAGVNWMLPTDAALQYESDLPYEAVKLEFLLDATQGATLRMVLLDACRENPWANKWTSPTHTVHQGLAGEAGADDVMVVYAAAPGQLAEDGPTGADSPFASAAARRLQEPGLEIHRLAGAIRDDVLKASRGLQRPFEMGSISGDEITLVERASPLPPSTPMSSGGAVMAAPVPRVAGPSNSDVSLDDLKAQNDALRPQWELRLKSMRAAFDKVAAFQGPAELRRAAWDRFLAAYREKDPYSDDDDTLRAHAVSQRAAIRDRPNSVSAPTLQAEIPVTAAAPGLASLEAVTDHEWSVLSSEDIVKRFLKTNSMADLQSLAARGNAHAQQLLGTSYAYGYGGLTRDYANAIAWYDKAAAQQDERAENGIGSLYANGQGVKQDFTEAMDRYRRAADQGDANAQVNVGLLYANGQGVKQDFTQAMDWYRKAADQGHANAEFYIGALYDNGQGVKQDVAQAMDWYRKAADHGDADAEVSIGSLYANGQSVGQDFGKAMDWYRKAADKGDANAEYNIGLMYENGEGVTQDFAQAMDWYRKAADQGHASAETNVGGLYGIGRGVKQDFTEAMDWYRKAADQGDADAEYNIGVMYEHGEGVKPDPTQAMDWYRKAADQGSENAEFGIGVLYQEGQGVRQDFAQAIDWYRKAARKGYADAEFNIGLLYAHGQGVKQDYSEAMDWYRKAAAQGHAKAEGNVGGLYVSGQGVKRDPTQAMYWYRKAADQGDANGQFNIGVMFQNGEGVKQDFTQAMYWYRKAADQGYANAEHNIGLLYANGQGVALDKAKAATWLRKAADHGDSDARRLLAAHP